MKKENKGYNVNFVTNTVTVTKAFAQTAANNIFSEEFKIMKELREMGMTIVTKAPAKRKSDRLTYAKMEKHINCLSTAEEDMKEFEAVKEAAKGENNPYLFVKNWYERKFPTHNDVPEFDENLKIVNHPLNYADEEESA